MAFSDPTFEARRARIIGGSNSPVSPTTQSTSGFSDPTFEARRAQIISHPIPRPQAVKVPQQPVQAQPSSWVDKIKSFFIKTSQPEAPLPQASQKVGMLDFSQPQVTPSAQMTVTKGSLASAKQNIDRTNKVVMPIESAVNTATSKLSEGINKTVQPAIQEANKFTDFTLKQLNKHPVIKEAVKNVWNDYYNNLLLHPIDQVILDTHVLDKLPKNNPLLKFSQWDLQTRQELGKGIIQGIARDTLNWNDRVRTALDTEVKSAEKRGFKNVNTVGQLIGQIAPYVLGGEALGATRLAKIGIPLVFTTLGQTSLPSDTPGSVRVKRGIIDATAGTVFKFLEQPANILSLKNLGLKSAELSALTAQVYADARASGATHDEAMKEAKDALIFSSGLIGAFGVLRVGKMTSEALLKSKVKEGNNVFTPQDARKIVIETGLHNTPDGQAIIQASLKAEEQGKNVKISGIAAKRSKLANAVKAETPQGIRFNAEIVDAQPKIAPQAPEQPAQPEVNKNVPDVVRQELSKKPVEKQVFDYQSTQLNLPKAEAKKVTDFAQKIPESDLAKDPTDNYPAAQTGRENNPHITVLYGLDNTITADQIKSLLTDTQPITVTLGKTSLFSNDTSDVLKVDVNSPELEKLNKQIDSKLETPGRTFTDYKPHITIAYLKKGVGQKYAGDTSFEGQKITLHDLTFSTKNGEMISIPLGEKGDTSPAKGQLLHGTNNSLETINKEGLHYSRNASTKWGKAVFFTDSAHTATDHGANYISLPIDNFKLKVFNTEQEQESFMKEYHADNLADAIRKQGKYDGFTIANPDSKVGNTTGIVDLGKLNKLIVGKNIASRTPLNFPEISQAVKGKSALEDVVKVLQNNAETHNDSVKVLDALSSKSYEDFKSKMEELARSKDSEFSSVYDIIKNNISKDQYEQFKSATTANNSEAHPNTDTNNVRSERKTRSEEGSKANASGNSDTSKGAISKEHYKEKPQVKVSPKEFKIAKTEIPKEITQYLKDKFGTSFDKATKKQISDALLEHKDKAIPYSSDLLKKVGSPTRGYVDPVKEGRPTLFFGGVSRHVVTDGYILITDKKVADEMNKSLLEKEINTLTKDYVHMGQTHAEAEKTAKNAIQEKVSNASQFPSLEKVIPQDPGKPAYPQGLFSLEGNIVLALSDGVNQAVINLNKFALMSKELPDTKIFIRSSHTAVSFVRNDKIVGILMPLNGDGSYPIKPDENLPTQITKSEAIKPTSKDVTPHQEAQLTNVLANLEADIPIETAKNAHVWNSFDPEKAAKQEIISYQSDLTKAYDDLKKYVKTPEDQQTLDQMFTKFREGYKKRFLSSLNAKSKTASSAVTGAANFPVEKNRARLETERRITGQMYEYYDHMIKKIANTLNPSIINSANSNAIEQLQKKIDNLEQKQQLMLDANKIIRGGKDVESRLKELGISEDSIKKLLEPYLGRTGFQPFELNSNNNKIKTARARLEKLQKVKSTPIQEISFNGGHVVLNPNEFRVQIHYDSIPNTETRNQLKRSGFRWSPKNKAWQRQLTDSSIRTTERLLDIKLKTTSSHSGEGTYASKGMYAQLPNLTQEQHNSQTSPSHEEAYIPNTNVIEFPELVRLAKDLTGKVPEIKKYLGIGVKGKAYTNQLTVKLAQSLFAEKDLSMRAKVLSHELGHIIDILPEGHRTRTNLLGRIASLNRFLKHTLKEFPDSIDNSLTAEDRKAIMKRARELAKKPITVTEKVAEGESSIQPHEILAIWNDITAAYKDPELLSYIQSLSRQQKADIVRQAMKGKVADWVSLRRTKYKEITHEVIKNAPEDIRAMYQKLVKEEILARRLHDLKTIKNELWDLSKKWRPLGLGRYDTNFVRYRKSSSELYADAISVLFNDPVMLKQDAPNFWRAFFNYIDQKPTAKENLFALYDLLNQGEEAVYKARDEALNKSFQKAEETFVVKELERQKRQSSLLYQIRILVIDKTTPTIDRVNQVIKSGKTIPDNLNPIYALKGLNYFDGKLNNYVEDTFQPVFAKAQEVNDGWNKLGKILFFERVIYERGELANPQGYDPKTAQDQLTGLEKTMSSEDWQKLQQAKELFRNAVQESIDYAQKHEYYTPELIKQMKMNPAYAAYQVIDYLDTYVTARAYHSLGTLKDIANPATSTVMKLISLRKAIERNEAKKVNIQFFQQYFSESVKLAKTKWNGRSMTIQDTKEPTEGLVITIEKGKPQGYYLDKEIADSLTYTDNTTLKAAARVSRIIGNSGFYRGIFTTFNLGFQTFNFTRDFMRYWKNVPDYTLGEAITSFPRALVRYSQATPHALKRAFNMKDELITEMQNAKILGTSYNSAYRVGEDEERTQIERILQRYGALDVKKRSKVLATFEKGLSGLELVGNFIESLPKVAGYIELKGKMPENQLAEFVRTSIGSPDFRTGGTATPVTNSIFMFSNAIKEGIRSDMRIAFKKNQSRAGFWWKTLLGTFLPKFIMAAIAFGLVGKELQDQMDNVSEYDKTNYTVVPVGRDKNGKTVYYRIPQDETGRFLGGLLWKIININKDKEMVNSLFQIFAFNAGQLPNLSPSLVGAGALLEYLSGKNPYDTFRGKNVIPDTQFKAGVKESWPIFLNWLVHNQGLDIILPSYTPDGSASNLEKTLNVAVISNILGRWLKVSDYGKTEQLQQISAQQTQAQAQQTLDKRRAIDEAVKKYQQGKQSQAQIERDLVRTVIGQVRSASDKRSRTDLIKSFRIQTLKDGSTPQMKSLIYASSNQEKVALLHEAQSQMSQEAFSNLLSTAKKYKVISNDVLINFRKSR